MNKEQLKKTLRPLIKECIKEVIFEEGILSGIISEVVKGTGRQIVETQQPQSQYQEMHRQDHENRQRKMQENRQRMLDSIGREAYNGVDLFEGTQPLSSRGTAGASAGRGAAPHGAKALDGIAPNDPGVNLAALGVNPGIWKTLAGK